MTVHPIYFESSYYIKPELVFDELTVISRNMWTYLGHTSRMAAWHDEGVPAFLVKTSDKKIKSFLWEMAEADIDWRSYCILSFPLLDYQAWERITLLIRPKGHWAWMKQLRKYVGSAERLDELVDFMQLFIELQIESYGVAKIKSGKFVQRNSSGKGYYFAMYHALADRLLELESAGVDYRDWLITKFNKCKDFEKIDFIYLSTIVNRNALDPELVKVQAIAKDLWREVKAFLNLSTSCEMPDGCIPKGWTPASIDMRATKDIVKIVKEGFYFYADGEQRRGKFHYAKNTNCIIMCTPDNFEVFKEGWGNPMYLRGLPTWSEYRQWGLYPGRWDEMGKPIGGQGLTIKWRRG